MPPFVYPGYHNPYVQSISDLMLRQGDVQAQGLTNAAQAIAQGQRAAGGAWGQGIGQAGQDIGADITRVTSPQYQLAQSQVNDLKALDRAFTTPGGPDAILNALPGHLRPQVASSFAAADEARAKLNEANLKSEDATNQYVFTLADSVKMHDYDPAALQLGLSHAKQTFSSNPSLINQIAPIEAALHSNPTPEGVRAIVDPIIRLHESQEKPVILPATPRGGAPAQLIRPTTGEQIATGQPAPAQPPTPTQVALDAATLGTPQETPTARTSATAVNLEHPKPIEAAQHQAVLLDGKPAIVQFEPKSKKWLTASGQEIVNADNRIRPIPPPSVQIHNEQQAAWTPDQINFYAQQVKEDASKWNLVPPAARDAVGRRIASLGGDINKISEQSRSMAEMAKEILPHIDTIQAEANQLNQLGLLGPIGSRWRDFLAGKIGAGELAGGNAQSAELIGKFKTDAGLLKTAVARAHGGARGGGSPYMLQHMSDLFGADKADLSTLTGELSGFKDWMTGYSQMVPGGVSTVPATSTVTAPHIVQWGRDKNGNPVRIGG